MMKAKRFISGILIAVLLLGFVPDLQTCATGVDSENMETSVVEMESSTVEVNEVEAADEMTEEEPLSEEYSADESPKEVITEMFSEDEQLSTEIVLETFSIEEPETETNTVDETQPVSEEIDPEGSSAGDEANEIQETDTSETEEEQTTAEEDITKEKQYVVFPDGRNDIVITVPDAVGIVPIEHVMPTTLYEIDPLEVEEFAFEASVRNGYKIELPTQFREIIAQQQERVFDNGRWVYQFSLQISKLSTTQEDPLSIWLNALQETVLVKVNGDANAIVEGVDETGMASLGSIVTIEVTEPGYTLALLTTDGKGNVAYTAMELDYDNRYAFTVEKETEFVVADPEQVDYTIAYSSSRKAKLTGAEGIKLSGLGSSAQGYKEVVLNFTAIKNGSDGTETEKVYYEVKVTATPNEKAGETIPSGSSATPRYYYIPKVADVNTQSKSIQVNKGDVSASTACTYEFSVRMVLIGKNVKVPNENTAATSPLNVNLEGNTITKSFATKNLYYEDKLGFTKKNVKIFTGQQDALVGSVKYSKKASYLHDLTAVAYDKTGAVCEALTCTFKNDNDELYVSADEYIIPGKYNVVVYAGIGEKATANSPQGGTMYQANTSIPLTIEPGINWIYTSKITTQAAINSKDITFSAVPVGYSGYGYQAKVQKFTYEIKSATPNSTGSGYTVTEPVDKVKNNISVDKNGKVKVKKEYYVDTDTSKNYIAVVIRGADFAGNEAEGIAYVQIVASASVPTEIRLIDSNGRNLGTRTTADKADGARVVVLDQNGNNMNQYVTITPTDNAKRTAGIYVSQYGSSANLHVRKCSSVTIKATPKDGGKKSKTVTFTINAPVVTQACYSLISVTSNGFYASQFNTTTGLITYRAPRGAVIRFLHGARINNTGYYNRNWFDWEYSIEGGKLSFDGNDWLVTPTARTAKLTVWIKSNPRRTWYINFVNNNWGVTYDAAPKVTLTSGKLYSNKYTNTADLEYSYDDWEGSGYYPPEQKLTYQYEYGSYDQIRIARISKSGPYLWVEDFDPENRTFTLATSPGDDIKTGSCKYKVAFYKDNVLMCKPATIMVKVNKSTPVKIAPSYTLDSSQGNSVDLKCTPAEFVPDFSTNLLNANVGGTANDFNKYFELAYVTDPVTKQKRAVIQFKSTVKASDKESLKGKSLTGYVKYSYYYGYNHIENATSKITIKMK